MECKGIRERLPAYLEKGVTAQEETLIERHLSTCRKCARVLLDLKRTEEIVKDLDRVEPPPWMTQKVMSRIRAEEEKKGGVIQKLFFPLHVKIPVQAFATVVIAVVAIYVFKAVEPQMKTVPPPSAPEQVFSKEETPEPTPGTKTDSKVPGSKAAVKEPAQRYPKEGLARRADEKSREPLGEEKRASAESKEGLSIPGAGTSLPAEPPSQPAVVKKREVLQDRGEGPSRSQRASPAPAPIEKDEAVGSIGLTKSLSVAKERGKADQTRATVRVGDVSTAMKEVEELLARLGAQKIEKESLPNLSVITAELRTEKMQELFADLMVIGEVGVSSPSPTSAGEGVRIRIEILRNP
jgi:hypothetical protein